MSEILAFVDEYGDASLDIEREGVTEYFILSCVIVKAEALDETRKAAAAIAGRHFQKGEMKSAKIAGNDKRRIAVLKDLAGLNIRCHNLAVNKRNVNAESGLRYKNTFFKYLRRRLYSHLFKMYSSIHVVSDEHGTESFMKSFDPYLKKQFSGSFVRHYRHEFANSQNEIMLQVADVMCGSMARIVDSKKPTTQREDILDALSKWTFRFWPPRRVPPCARLEDSADPCDELVRQHCIRQSSIFIEDNEGSGDEDTQDQVRVLQYLVWNVEFRNPTHYVPSKRILERFESDDIGMSERRLRRAIGGLRDQGVIVASSPNGYKIPVTRADVHDFVAHGRTIITPMLSRLHRAHADLLEVSDGDLDILSDPGFEALKELVEFFNRLGGKHTTPTRIPEEV